jgi:hypothetical protein
MTAHLNGLLLAVAVAGAAVVVSAAESIPAFRETNVPEAKRALLVAELPKAYAAAVAELARERDAVAEAFAGAGKSFQAERVAKRMEMADRLIGCAAKDIARGDVTSLCFAEAEIEDLRAFAKYVAEERKAWKTFPANPSVKPVELNLADFGAKGDGVTDDGPALRSAIAAVKRLGGTPSVLRIPEGTFLIASPDPLTPDDRASNLVFPAVSNCVVTGVSPEKTKIRFGVYDARGLCVLNAYNSVFRDFEIRWQTTPYFQGTILDYNMEEGWFEVGHDEGTLNPTDPKWQVRKHPLGLHSFEPDGTFIKEPLLFWDRTAKDMGSGRYRLGFNRGMAGWKRAKPPRKGAKAALPDRLSGFEGFGLVGARLSTVENVWIRNSREAFLQPSQCYSCAAVRCRIFPEDGRVFSTNADGFYNSRGSWISECKFSNMGDDSCNSVMHGGEIAKVEGKVMLYKCFTRPPRPGDLWQIVESTTGEYLANLRVVSSGVREWNGTKWGMVEFSEEIPAGVNTYETIGRGEITAEEHRQISHGNLKLKRPPDLVFAPWAAGVGYVVRNNVFRNNRNTAMVVQCPNSLLENNLAEGMQNGLVIGELLNWNEGPAPYNIVVRNNRFVRNYHGLYVYSQMHNGAPPKTRPVRDLMVEGNTFLEPSYTAFELPAADSPVLRNNVILPQRRPRLAGTAQEPADRD